MAYQKSNKILRKKIVVVLAVIGAFVLLVCLFFILEKTEITNFLNNRGADGTDVAAQTTSELPSAQPDFNGGTAAEENKDPGNTLSEGRGSATIFDGNGQIGASIDTSSGVSSNSGEITLYNPIQDAEIQSGVSIAGSSTLQKIFYRVIDSVSGVISSGELKVVNGKFSGRLDFNTNASEGRIDIYGVRSDATEFSNINIAVRFK